MKIAMIANMWVSGGVGMLAVISMPALTIIKRRNYERINDTRKSRGL